MKNCFQIPVDWEIDALQRTQHFVFSYDRSDIFQS
jgi:hypothetical protein